MIKIKLYSGYIKNWKKLCKALNICATNQKDCIQQILINGYKKWNQNLPKHLNGVFCFAIYDDEKDKLFCARDPFGAKPFYYFYNKSKIIYGTTIKNILKNKLYTKEVDLSVLQNYLSYTYVAGENLLFKDIKKLMPGCSLIFENNKVNIKKYFNISKQQDTSKSLDYWVKKLHQTIKKSTFETLDDNEIINTKFMLSSGVDSSYLYKLSNINNAVTFGYKDNQYDESCVAQNFAQSIGKNCDKILINSRQFLNEVKNAIKALELPISSPASIVYSYAFRHFQEDTKICLTGDLSDELFGGYDIYKYSDEFGDELENFYIGKTNIMQEDIKFKILKNYDSNQSPTDILQTVYFENKKHDTLTKMMQVDLNFWVEGNSMLNAYKYALKLYQ